MSETIAENAGRIPSAAPRFDAATLEGVLERVELRTIELVHSRFGRQDDGPLPVEAAADRTPQIGIDVDWAQADDGSCLGCLVRLATMFPGSTQETDESETEQDAERSDPYFLQVEYRIIYRLAPDCRLSKDEIAQLAYWEATEVVWPYFRAHLAETLEGAGLPRVLLGHLRRPAR